MLSMGSEAFNFILSQETRYIGSDSIIIRLVSIYYLLVSMIFELGFSHPSRSMFLDIILLFVVTLCVGLYIYDYPVDNFLVVD